MLTLFLLPVADCSVIRAMGSRVQTLRDIAGRAIVDASLAEASVLARLGLLNKDQITSIDHRTIPANASLEMLQDVIQHRDGAVFGALVLSSMLQQPDRHAGAEALLKSCGPSIEIAFVIAALLVDSTPSTAPNAAAVVHILEPYMSAQQKMHVAVSASRFLTAAGGAAWLRDVLGALRLAAEDAVRIAAADGAGAGLRVLLIRVCGLTVDDCDHHPDLAALVRVCALFA